MPIPRLIKAIAKKMGFRPTRKEDESWIPRDIAGDQDFMIIYRKVKPYTMVDVERCYALYQSVQ